MKSLKSFSTNKALGDFNIVLFENIFSKGINFLLILLLARTLGPEKYGICSLVTVSILFLVPILDFGLENTLVRFSSKHQSEKDRLFGFYFVIKTATIIILWALVFLFPNIIPAILNKPQIQKYLSIILIGFAIENYRLIITAYYQTTERFFVRALVNIGTFLLRLTSIFVLLKLSVTNIRIITLCFALAGTPFIIFFGKQFTSFVKEFFCTKFNKEILNKLFHYQKWIFLAAIPIKIMTRLDFYVAAYFLSLKEIGFYNVATQFASAFAVIPLVLGTVFLPKASKHETFIKMKSFIKKMVKICIPVTILVIPIVLFSTQLILFFFGDKYSDASYVLQILLIAVIFSMWTVMIGTIFYALGKVRYMAIGAYVQIIIFILAAYIFTPKWGMKGIAWSKVFANISYLITTAYFLLKHIYPSFKQSDS